ncbi:MAG: YaiI/YqxD family protein [Candidatus Obscuribacterales bacterium]
MKIWVDADACPVALREIISRAAHKRQIDAIFVTNSELRVPESPFISVVRVEGGPDRADDYIAEQAEAGDLAITQDIPLAHRLVDKDVLVIEQRGVLLTRENIGERLSIRDFMQDLRDAGLQSGGPSPFGEKEKRAFAATFDRVVTKKSG